MNIKTVSQISEELTIPDQTLRAAIKAGLITGTKSGSVWLVDTESETFRRWLGKRPAPGRGRKPRRGA